MNQEAFDLIIKARISLMRRKPFFGHLAMNLKIEELSEEKCKVIKTACTNGRSLMYNPDYILEINKEDFRYVETLVVHEVMHCAFSHITRRGSRRAVTWNYATDYWINGNLADSEDPFKLKSEWLYEKKYAGLSSDEIYELIIDKVDQLIKDGKTTVDFHLDDGDKESGEGLSGPEAEGLSEYWKDALAAAHSAANSNKAGNLSASLQKYLEDLFEPKIKWHDKIRTTVAEHTKTDYSWKTPNRRTFSSGFILPAMDKQTKVKIAIAIDTSGSIINEISSFFSEIKGIVSTYREFEIYIACFDSEVKTPFIIKSMSDFDEYLGMIEGGGGTDFISWWNWFYNEGINEKVDTVIFFTDMYPCGDFVRKDHDFDNLYWVAKGSSIVGPVGTTLFYDE